MISSLATRHALDWEHRGLDEVRSSGLRVEIDPTAFPIYAGIGKAYSDVRVTRVEHSPMRILQGDNDDDTVAFTFITAGARVLEYRNVTHRVGPGAIYYELGSPCDSDWVVRPTTSIRISVPLMAMPGFETGQRFGVFTADRDSAVLRSIFALVGVLARPAAPEEDPGAEDALDVVGSRILKSVLTTLTAVATGSLSLDDGPGDPASEAARIIREHHTDPAFSVTRLASMTNFSPRSIQRYFVKEGTTARAAIADARLATAQRLVRETPGLRVAEVARRSGFGTVARLRRAEQSRG